MSVFVLYFGRHLWTVYRIDANDTPLEIYGKCAISLFLANFRNSLQFKSSFKNKQFCFKSSGLFFGKNFQTAYRKVTNDTTLERYWLGATFLWRQVFWIPYRLWIILTMQKMDKRPTRTIWNWHHCDIWVEYWWMRE